MKPKLIAAAILFIAFIQLTFCTPVAAQCNQNYSWATWSNFTGKSATGTVVQNGKSISVEMISNFDFTYTSSIFNHGAFRNFGSAIPNSTVPATTWAAGPGGTTTMCFSEEVENPVLLIASLGAGGTTVDLSFSEPYLVAFDGGGMQFPDNTTIRGTEGYAVIVFPGKFRCVTINSTVPEYYTNITWGLNPPLFPVTITGPTTGCESVTLTASGGATYRWSGGRNPNAATNTFTASGTYSLEVTDANGCTVTTLKTVTVNKSIATSETKTICQGNSYLGKSSSGNHRVVLKRTNGCDSIINLALTVTPPPQSRIAKSICAGESYEGYTASGTYTDVFKLASGCDSVRILELTVGNGKTETIYRTVCEGSSVEGYSTSGVYTDVFPQAGGCDSTRILHLTVLPKKQSTVFQQICAGQTFEGYNHSGTYIDVFAAQNGCDSTRTLILEVLDAITTEISKTICKGETFEGYSTSGTYRDVFTTAGGCDSIRVLHLLVKEPPQPNLGPEQAICPGATLRLNPGTFDTYQWQDGSAEPFFEVSAPGTYRVTVTNGCGNATASVQVVQGNCAVYFPTAFTPNGDGRNDRFKALNAFGLKQFQLTVYDRWGNVVFRTDDFTKGWDGRVAGKPMPGGVYVWHGSYVQDGERWAQKGSVLLIR